MSMNKIKIHEGDVEIKGGIVGKQRWDGLLVGNLRNWLLRL